MVRLILDTGKNQDELHTDRYIYLFSYEKPVAIFDRVTKTKYKTSEYHSATTQKQMDHWMHSQSTETKSIEQSQIESIFERARVEPDHGDFGP